MTPHDIAEAAQAYVERGWAVVALHDVVGGSCSCGSADPRHAYKQGGKHPLDGGWQNRGLRTIAAIRDQWARRPGANLGIVTGRASGIWVLDVDPDNGGDKQLAALVSAFGPLPETYAVRTGSGGTHYYWSMPDFDFTNSRGRLPLGLDVRANASQVVAPPSFTLKGSYAVVLDVPTVAAPGWLLDMIRPAEVKPTLERETWPGWEPGAIAGAVADRGPTYARTAVRALLGQLAAAQPGERNTVAYRVGRRLAELVAAPWAALDTDEVWAGYMSAAAACDVDGGFTQSEAYDVLVKAVRDQQRAGRVAELPPADHLGTVVNWTPPTDFDHAGQDPALSSISTNVAEPGAADPFEAEVLREMGRLMVRAEAARRLTEKDRLRTDFAAEALDDAGMDELPPAVPLVADWLDLDSLVRVNGPSGHGKSFVVLDLGACVATGTPWHGRAVTKTRVCYVLAESARGMVPRAAAWRTRHGLNSTGITFIARPVQIKGPEWEAFTAWCVAERFGLVIFDTQAQSTVGRDENDATEMGEVMAALVELRAATQACTMLVHHRGLRGDHGRGTTAVRGALDTELDVSRQGTTITLKSTKQKDRADPATVLFTMTPVEKSIVLISESDVMGDSGPFVSPAAPQLTLREKCAAAIAHALIDASGSGLTRSEAQAHARVALTLDSSEATKRIVRRAWSDLIGLGRIAKAQGREAHFFIELDGAPVLQANPGKLVSGGPELYVP